MPSRRHARTMSPGRKAVLTMDPAWHEDDRFWETFYPVMFHAGRWEAAADEAVEAAALLELPKGAEILDFCCGPGRHAIELANLGYGITGLDRTQRYLDIAREKAGEVGVQATFVQGDARLHEWDRSFDAALSLYTSFGYFEDPGEDRMMLSNVHAALGPGGRILLDMSGKEVVARAFAADSSEILADGMKLTESRTVEPDWEWVRNTWVIEKDGQRHETTFRVRVYPGVELKAVLLSVGFSDVRLYGSLDGTPYDQQARREVAVAAKP